MDTEAIEDTSAVPLDVPVPSGDPKSELHSIFSLTNVQLPQAQTVHLRGKSLY